MMSGEDLGLRLGRGGSRLSRQIACFATVLFDIQDP